MKYLAGVNGGGGSGGEDFLDCFHLHSLILTLSLVWSVIGTLDAFFLFFCFFLLHTLPVRAMAKGFNECERQSLVMDLNV